MARTRYSPRSHLNIASLQVPEGYLNVGGTDVTSSAAELNKLDGATVTTAELNTLAGQTGYPVQCAEVTFTETTGAGVWTGAFSLPAGATITNIIVYATALWNSQTSATLKVGDTDDDGFYAGVDLMATDLLAGESLSFQAAGGKAGVYLAGTGTHWTNLYSATARTINAIITKVGSSGTAGRTRVTVLWSVPTATAASKV